MPKALLFWSRSHREQYDKRKKRTLQRVGVCEPVSLYGVREKKVCWNCLDPYSLEPCRIFHVCFTSLPLLPHLFSRLLSPSALSDALVALNTNGNRKQMRADKARSYERNVPDNTKREFGPTIILPLLLPFALTCMKNNIFPHSMHFLTAQICTRDSMPNGPLGPTLFFLYSIQNFCESQKPIAGPQFISYVTVPVPLIV